MPEQTGFDWSGVTHRPVTVTAARSHHLLASHHSAMAGLEAAKSAANKAAKLLQLITAAGDAGMSDHEIHLATRWPRQTICGVRNSVRIFLTAGARRGQSPYNPKLGMTCWVLADADTIEAQAARDVAEAEARGARCR